MPGIRARHTQVVRLREDEGRRDGGGSILGPRGLRFFRGHLARVGHVLLLRLGHEAQLLVLPFLAERHAGYRHGRRPAAAPRRRLLFFLFRGASSRPLTNGRRGRCRRCAGGLHLGHPLSNLAHLFRSSNQLPAKQDVRTIRQLV